MVFCSSPQKTIIASSYIEKLHTQLILRMSIINFSEDSLYHGNYRNSCSNTFTGRIGRLA